MPPEDERCPAEPDLTGADEVGESPDTGSAPVPVEDGDAIPESPDLAGVVERLTDELAGLRADFAAKIRYDEVKERQISSMHEELQAFRTGLHLRLLQPVFTDLIAMHDDLADMANGGDAAAELGSFRESVLETLARNGVSSYEVPSPEVDKARQRVIRVIHTSDEKLDRHVESKLRVGFEYDSGKVLRPEWVVAYRHVPDTEPPDMVPETGGE